MSLRRAAAMVVCLTGLGAMAQARPLAGQPDARRDSVATPIAPSLSTRQVDGAHARVERRRSRVVTGPVALLLGFRMLDGGGSRVYVELTGAARVEVLPQPLSLVYRLKGAKVLSRNNRNPLITTHFSSPVSRAQLVPRGADLDVVLTLRAPATGKYQMVDSGGGAFRLEIDFPAGPYPTEPDRRDPPAPPEP